MKSASGFVSVPFVSFRFVDETVRRAFHWQSSDKKDLLHVENLKVTVILLFVGYFSPQSFDL